MVWLQIDELEPAIEHSQAKRKEQVDLILGKNLYELFVGICQETSSGYHPPYSITIKGTKLIALH